MASAGSIFVDLLLRDANYAQGLNRARGNTRRFSGQVSGDVGKVQSAFSGVLSPVNNASMAIAQLGGVVAGALSVQRVVQYSDTWRQLEGRLNIVAGSMGDVGQQQEQLFEIAQRTRQPLEGILSFYTRLAQFIPEAERAQYDLLGVTESVSAALAITGETSASATGAMIQFTQAIGTNFEAAGQELRSLQEQAPRLTMALMNALGDGTKSLQQLKDEGKLTRESVLNALSGMGEEGQKLREELDQVSLTVGQAFTRLDSAFLKFIGQSETANAGTSSLAASINFLAQNLDLAAKAGIAIATVMTTRVVTSFVAARGGAFAYQLALARMAGISSVAATATLGLSASLSTLRLAFAAIGGPVGIAVLGALALMSTEAEYAAETQSRLNDEVGKFENEAIKYASASEQLKDQIRGDTADRISQYEKELLAVQELFNAYQSQGFLGRFADNLGSSIRRRLGIGGGEGIADIAGQGAALEASINRLRELQSNYDNVDRNPFTPSPGGGDDKAAKKRIDELNKSYERYEYLIKNVSKEQLKYAEAEEAIGELYKANRISLDEYFGALDNLDGEFDQLAEKAQKTGVDLEQFGKRAAENIQDSFADFLFDPFDEGLQGMAKGFIDTIRRMIAEAQAAKLAQSLFGDLVEGGEGGGFLGSIFGGKSDGGIGKFFAGMFADGGVIPPGQFGIVGEGGGWQHAEVVMGGQSGATVIPQNKMKGGNVYQIDARGADQGAVRRLEQALLALAGPGVIEQRVTTAQARGAL